MDNNKSRCRHSFKECLITYHYKTIINHDSFEITRHTEYCAKCGFVNNKRFEGDLVKRRMVDTDKFSYTIMSKNDLLEKYKDLPQFDVNEDEVKNNRVKV